MTNKISIKTVILMLLSALILTSCGGNRKSKDREDYLPNITGNSGEVLVVINKGYWEGELGSTLRKILAGEYPFLPQREPVFKLFNCYSKRIYRQLYAAPQHSDSQCLFRN